MSGLFAFDDVKADRIYQRMRAAEHPVEARLKGSLETMWAVCEPYLDSDFCNQFRFTPEARYAELHLTTTLINAGKILRRRDALKKSERDKGPDICIPDGDRTIWIENISQSRGDEANRDQIPNLPRDGRAQWAPHEQVALRITNALATKHAQFETYKSKGLVKPNDLCVVAISGAQFFSQSGSMDLPMAVKAVYPFGDEYFSINVETGDVTGRGRHYSPHITRAKGEPIPRDGFVSGAYGGLSGLIWSRATIGNSDRPTNDLVFVHNKTAGNRFLERWMNWAKEFVVEEPPEGGLLLIDLTDETTPEG